MRAAVMKGGKINIAELPDPVPRNGQVLIAPAFTGICGSDLHLREMLEASAQSLSEAEQEAMPPIVPGHEFSASIIEFGKDTNSSLSTRDRVVAIPFTPLGNAFEIVGLSPVHPGGIATLSLVDAERCLRIPDATPDDHAALTEPLAVGIHAANLANRRAGPNVILGCGPVGLAVILALKAQGRGPILAADFSPERRAIAEKLGADILVDPAQDSAFEHWKDLEFQESQASPLLTPDQISGWLGPNIFDCVGAPGILDNIIKHAPRHSHIIVVGVCPHEDKYAPQDAVMKEVGVEFSFAYTPQEFAQSLKMIGQHADAVSSMITSRLPLTQTAEAFERLADRPNEIKVLIDPRMG